MSTVRSRSSPLGSRGGSRKTRGFAMAVSSGAREFGPLRDHSNFGYSVFALVSQDERSVMNGKDILALGWPAGKVIGLGLEAAGILESRGLSEEETLARLEEVRQDPGGALEREAQGRAAALPRVGRSRCRRRGEAANGDGTQAPGGYWWCAYGRRPRGLWVAHRRRARRAGGGDPLGSGAGHRLQAPSECLRAFLARSRPEEERAEACHRRGDVLRCRRAPRRPLLARGPR